MEIEYSNEEGGISLTRPISGGTHSVYIDGSTKEIFNLTINGQDVSLPDNELYEKLVNGDFGKIKPYVPIPEYEPTEEELLYSKRLTMECTGAQALIALHNKGKLDAVQAAVNADPIFKIAFERAYIISRLSPTVSQIGKVAGLSDAELDKLFIDAMEIIL